MQRKACAAPKCVHGKVDEFELIRRYFARQGGALCVFVGFGDDGAGRHPEPGRDLVSVIDTLVEGTHFYPDLPAADLGYRVVAVNLSDIAAMGARPLWMTLALTLPRKSEQWISDFAKGLFAAADEHQVSLVGGDTTSGDTLVASVQVTGDVTSGAAVLRSGAEAGDTVYVTGTLGDAAAGLSMAGSKEADEYLLRRFQRPSARVAVGLELPHFASACIDISDGLVGDLKKLLDASEVGADLDLDALPFSDPMIGAFNAAERLQFAATGGDDYELCFTSAKSMPDAIAGVAVTAIGTITAGPGLDCRSGGRNVDIDDSGYRHLQ